MPRDGDSCGSMGATIWGSVGAPDRDPMTIETAEQRLLSTVAIPSSSSSSSKQASSMVWQRVEPCLSLVLEDSAVGLGYTVARGAEMVYKVPITVENKRQR